MLFWKSSRVYGPHLLDRSEVVEVLTIFDESRQPGALGILLGQKRVISYIDSFMQSYGVKTEDD